MPDVHEVLVTLVNQEQRNLENAVRRRKRAMLALRKADDDIATISGALMALESVFRKMNAQGEEPPPAPELTPTTKQIISTLSGDLILEDL